MNVSPHCKTCKKCAIAPLCGRHSRTKAIERDIQSGSKVKLGFKSHEGDYDKITILPLPICGCLSQGSPDSLACILEKALTKRAAPSSVLPVRRARKWTLTKLATSSCAWQKVSFLVQYMKIVQCKSCSGDATFLDLPSHARTCPAA